MAKEKKYHRIKGRKKAIAISFKGNHCEGKR